MDMSSFPKMLQFKRKMLPQPQLLRWANWFSQWQFDVKHIKGKDNAVADFFSRPPKPPLQMISPVIPCIYPLSPSPSILDQIFNLPLDVKDFILRKVIPERSIENFKRFLEITIFNHGLVFRGLKFHPDFPFLTPFHIHNFFKLPKEALCFLWYLCEAFTVAFVFKAPSLVAYLSIIHHDLRALNDLDRNFWKFMTWFKPIEIWLDQLQTHHSTYVLITFHRPLKNIFHYTHRLSPSHFTRTRIQAWYPYNLSKEPRTPINADWTHFLSMMCALNRSDMNTIPPEILWGQEVWNPSHPLSLRLIDNLFRFNELHEDSEASNGLQSSGSENPFVGNSSQDSEGWPDSDDTFG